MIRFRGLQRFKAEDALLKIFGLKKSYFLSFTRFKKLTLNLEIVKNRFFAKIKSGTAEIENFHPSKAVKPEI